MVGNLDNSDGYLKRQRYIPMENSSHQKWDPFGWYTSAMRKQKKTNQNKQNKTHERYYGQQSIKEK